MSDDGLSEARQEFDRRNLYQFFYEGSYDLVLDSDLLRAAVEQEKPSNLHLYNLDRDLAWLYCEKER